MSTCHALTATLPEGVWYKSLLFAVKLLDAIVVAGTCDYILIRRSIQKKRHNLS